MDEMGVAKLTQILHILIRGQCDKTTLLLRPHARTVRLVYHNAVRDAGGQKGHAIRKGGPFGVVVEGDVRQAVAERGQQQRDMSSEPGKL